MTSIFPRHDFEKLTQIHHSGQKSRSFNGWSQFFAMMIAQVSWLKSLCDISANWYQFHTEKKITFVTRLKTNVKPYFPKKRPGGKSPNIIGDKTVRFEEVNVPLRIVSCKDPETGKQYDFLIYAMDLKTTTIANLNKERWKIEQFFMWIKQNLKFKTFLSTSTNAVLTQIWTSLNVFKPLTLGQSDGARFLRLNFISCPS